MGRVLLTGDVHLGRSSSRMPDALKNEARAASAWARIVALAVEQQVSAVLLSGDVVDESNRFWEAIGPLDAGIKRLAGAGIRVLAVAGNHDHAVLDRLAGQLPPEQFVLLGRGGAWERFSLCEKGNAWLNVDGWSFPQSSVYVNPLESYNLPPDPNVPTLGFVHGDLGVVSSKYAPLDLERMQALPPQAWLLGHLHAPQLIAPAGRPWVLMPGSPQALDPGETGAHGPWITAIAGTRIEPPHHRPLSSVWYGEVAIDLSAANDEQALERLILEGLLEHSDAIVQQAGGALAHISLRLRLAGTTPVAQRVSGVAERLRADLVLQAHRVSVTVDKVFVETTLPLDLQKLANGNSVPAAVVRLLLDLDNPEPTPDTADLIQKTRLALERAGIAKEFTALPRCEVGVEHVRNVVRLRARTLLTHLSAEGAR